MKGSKRPRDLTYEAKARLADNLFLRRTRAEFSQEELAEFALVSAGRIGDIENGKVTSMLDTYVRLAGALSITLDDLLAGVTWTPGEIEFEIDAGYEVTFETEAPEGGEEGR
ncbi:MAG TPA: helix-turn-helix transcriptional regulator [Solirubrobacterales bacterium]|nr:helix-turn-helix transcriptional regulator [Solirubrobacterales bacterium]